MSSCICRTFASDVTEYPVPAVHLDDDMVSTGPLLIWMGSAINEDEIYHK